MNLLQHTTRSSEEYIKNSIRRTANDSDKYKFQECVPRNIVVIGRTRCGKTTMIRVIEDLGYIPPTLSLYSGTRNIDIRHLGATVAHNGKKYNINIIDTPGFYDKVSSGETKLTNDHIKGLIDQCISHQITEIHVFAFAFSLENGINSDDVESMKFIKRKYPQLKSYFALILTHCERLSPTARKKLVDDFFQVDEIRQSQLKDYFELGVHFMGSLDPLAVAQGLLDAIASQIQNLIPMREEFIDFILQREEFYNIHTTSATTSCTLS